MENQPHNNKIQQQYTSIDHFFQFECNYDKFDHKLKTNK